MRFNVTKMAVYTLCQSKPAIHFASLSLYPLNESLILFILALVAMRFKTRLSIHLIHESDNKKYIYIFPPVCELKGVEKKSYMQHADACNETLCVKKVAGVKICIKRLMHCRKYY